MKRKNINKRLRVLSICSFLIILIIFSFFLYKELKYPAIQEEKVAVYSYSNKVDVRYKVLLKPNIIYENRSLDEDGIYISPYVDTVQTSFNYLFEGERNADITGDYEVIAVVEGYMVQDKVAKTIWEKRYIIEPKTSFEVRDIGVALAKDIPIQIAEYNNFVKKVIEDSKVQSSSKLSLIMNIDLKVNTDKGLVEEKMSPSIIIPLNTNYFEITKNVPEEKKGAIEETRQVQLPVNKNKVIIYSSILGLMAMILLYLIFFTAGYVKDEFTKQLDKIFKKHGSRLVALNNNIATSSVAQTVKSIDDLVRIADEIGKPILYKYSANPREITQFYVLDENTLYIFNLKKAVEAIELEKTLKSHKRKRDEKAVENNKDKNLPS